MLHDNLSFTSFAITYAMVASVPGPNFAIVANAGIAGRRRAALAALGVACGAAALASLALIILARAVPAAAAMSPQVRLGLGLVYGALLLRCGIACLTLAPGRPRRPLSTACAGGDTAAGAPSRAGPWRHPFLVGFATAATNPGTLAFFLAASGHLASGERALAPAVGVATVFVIALCWFGLLGYAVSCWSAMGGAPGRRRLLAWLPGLVLVGLGVGTIARAILQHG